MKFFFNLIIKISSPKFTNQLKLNLFSNHLSACLGAQPASGLAFPKFLIFFVFNFFFVNYAFVYFQDD